MKFWTLQRKKVCEQIERDGYYQPDFNFSEYLHFNEELFFQYEAILSSFNEINGTEFPGLIFAFAKEVNGCVEEISDLTDFCLVLQKNKDTLRPLWEHYNMDDMVLMELSYDNDFNPILIEYNNYQFLGVLYSELPYSVEVWLKCLQIDLQMPPMPERPESDLQKQILPCVNLAPYGIVLTYQLFTEIICSILQGKYFPTQLAEDVTQAHLPGISKKNIVNIYPVPDIE